MDMILGTAGIYTPSEETYSATLPRVNVKVTVGSEALSPFLGLASWAAVTRDRHHGGALLLQVWKGFTSFTLPSGLTITVIDQCGPAPGAKVNPILESRQGTM